MNCKFLLCFAACLACRGWSATPIEEIVKRLDRLEQENRSLREEVRQLRAEVEKVRVPEAKLQERMEIQERRVEEQAQTKVEASQRFPIRLTGMALVNVFHNGPYANGADTPITASPAPGRATAAASVRQSIIGLEYRGPATLWGGKVSGSFFADFFDSFTEGVYNPARVRTASVRLDWRSRSVMIGQEKPLFAPRDPSSFSYVGVSPLTGSGNLWRWQPQIRFEQRIPLGTGTQLRAQTALFQTSEQFSYSSTDLDIERRRPGLQGRFEISHHFDDTRRVEVAPGFHFSTTHAAGASVPSRLFALDWFANPWEKLEFSGAFFSGQNVAHFGALRQGFTIRRNGNVIPVHSRGGWGQLSFPFTSRVTLNIFGGVHDDRNRDLGYDGIAANRTGAANLMYRLAPNVILSIEALQMRTTYLEIGTRHNNRYDLAVAYLF